MTQQQIHHRIVIIGGGNAGIAVAAQLTKRGESDIAIIDPAETHGSAQTLVDTRGL